MKDLEEKYEYNLYSVSDLKRGMKWGIQILVKANIKDKKGIEYFDKKDACKM